MDDMNRIIDDYGMICMGNSNENIDDYGVTRMRMQRIMRVDWNYMILRLEEEFGMAMD